MNLSTKQKQGHRQRSDLWLPWGDGGVLGGQKDWEFAISNCKLLCTGQINNKVLLYSTENYIQYPVTNHNGKECEIFQNIKFQLKKSPSRCSKCQKEKAKGAIRLCKGVLTPPVSMNRSKTTHVVKLLTHTTCLGLVFSLPSLNHSFE